MPSIYITVDGSTDWLLFAINMKTGVIVSAAVVDDESKPEYSIIVLATDGGQPPLQTSAVVHINVVQNPDSQLSNVQNIQVIENVNPGTIIGTVPPPSVISKYSSNPPSFYYYVVNGDVFGTFAINVTTGDLYVSTEVDYELCSQYTLKVMMTNTDPLDLTSTMATVSVNIVDVNDNAPTFVLSPAIFTMREKVPIGTAAFSAAAIDADKGPNGRVTYAISSQSPSGTWFTIDSSTGMLTVNQLVDWQVVKTIALVVTACDNPVIPVARLCSSQTVLAIIEDLNDNAPKFVTNTSTVVSVREDAPVGTVVFRVIATDPDFGVNSLISYAIDSGAEDGCLQINSSTGNADCCCFHMHFIQIMPAPDIFILCKLSSAQSNIPSECLIVIQFFFTL
jgi:protocadherin-16/23